MLKNLLCVTNLGCNSMNLAYRERLGRRVRPLVDLSVRKEVGLPVTRLQSRHARRDIFDNENFAVSVHRWLLKSH